MNLIINSKPNLATSTKDCFNISNLELKNWIKSGAFLSKMFRFKNVNYIANSLGAINKPLLIMIIIFLLGRGEIMISEYRSENQKKITFIEVSLQFYYAIIDYFTLPAEIRKIKTKVPASKSVLDLKKINRDDLGPLIYLRTDFWFGVDSGGSVGHIAGVLNQLSNFYSSLFFYTTDFIPTVSAKVKQNILTPNPRFWNFAEVPAIISNENFHNQIISDLKNIKPSLIYQRYSINNFLGLRLGKELNIPFVLEYNGSEIWISHNWGYKLKYKSLSMQIENANLQGADLIVVVSKPMKEELVERGIDSYKILVNPNGVDPEKYSPDIDGEAVRSKLKLNTKTVIGFIGTFGYWHGAEILAEAFVKLLDLNPEYSKQLHLLMIGDGITIPSVRNIIFKNKLEDFCTFTGTVPQCEGPNYLAACDILASPHVPNLDGTPFFGSPTKLFEYMAMGKGIVASDLEQIGEVLSHNHTAWLVKPGDSDALAAGLERLINDAVLRNRLGLAARSEVIVKYSWLVHTRRIIQKLEEHCVG
jgi:glycosyltransferase involved in cell wall biosynthesis